MDIPFGSVVTSDNSTGGGKTSSVFTFGATSSEAPMFSFGGNAGGAGSGTPQFSFTFGTESAASASASASSATTDSLAGGFVFGSENSPAVMLSGPAKDGFLFSFYRSPLVTTVSEADTKLEYAPAKPRRGGLRAMESRSDRDKAKGVTKLHSQSDYALTQRMRKLLANEQHSDVVFVVGEKKARIHAHSLLVATAAPGLFALIDKARKEASSSSHAVPVEVAVPNVEPGEFAVILEFIYTDQCLLNESNCLKIMAIANEFKVPVLPELAQSTMTKSLDPSNACSYLLRDDFKGTQVAADAFEVLVKHPIQCSHTDGWANLTEELIVRMLSDSRNCADELGLFRAVVRWGEAQLKKQGKEKNTENMRVVLAKIIPLIRFPTLMMQDMISDIVPSGLLTEEQMIDVFSFIGARGTPAEPKSQFNTTPRTRLFMVADAPSLEFVTNSEPVFASIPESPQQLLPTLSDNLVPPSGLFSTLTLAGLGDPFNHSNF